MRYLILILLALSMVGCAVYKPRTGNGPGYSELQIDANVYRVTLRGNGSTKPDQADEMALLRASELMLSKDFAYFMIADGSDSVESNSFTTPVQSSTRGYIQGSGSTARYSAKTTYSGGQTFNVHVPTVTKTVVGFKDRPTSGGIVYNSQQIFDSLAARYVK